MQRTINRAAGEILQCRSLKREARKKKAARQPERGPRLKTPALGGPMDGCARAPDGRSLAFAELAAEGLRVTTAFGNGNRLTYTYEPTLTMSGMTGCWRKWLSGSTLGRVMRPHHSAQTAEVAEVKPQKAEVLTS